MEPAKSFNHHYIPQFFIKGFIAPEKQILVYDKLTDKIKPANPRYIFSERNRNTVNVAGTPSDILETTLYQHIDKTLSVPIKRLQTNQQNTSTVDDLLFLQLFVLTTIYRTPVTEKWAQIITEKYLNKPIPQKWRNLSDGILKMKIPDEDIVKLMAGIGPYLMVSMGREEMKGPLPIVLIGKPEPSFILADLPVLYKRRPSNLREFMQDYIFPYTSRRVFMSIKNPERTLLAEEIDSINHLLAIQANRYFGSENRATIERTVEKFRLSGQMNPDLFWDYAEYTFDQLVKKQAQE